MKQKIKIISFGILIIGILAFTRIKNDADKNIGIAIKMKQINLIGIVLLITIIASCRSENKNELTEKTFPVIIVEFSHSDTTTLTIRKKDGVKYHLFGLDSDGEYEIIMGLPFELNPNKESEILIDTIPTKLIFQKRI